MKGTEKQIAYAEALKAQFIAPRAEEMESHKRIISQYEERMAADPSRDYSEKIARRSAKIARLNAQIEAVNAIEDAGELIDAIKYLRTSLYFPGLFD